MDRSCGVYFRAPPENTPHIQKAPRRILKNLSLRLVRLISMTYNETMPILDPLTLEFFSRSPEQTRRLGMRLGALMAPGDLLCLSGDLGAGKTTFVQGIAQGWGSLDAVSSPTFVIVNTYRKPDGVNLYHLDAYRIGSILEAEELDMDLMLETGALIVEWPERIEAALPKERLWVSLRYIADEQRGMVFTPCGKRFSTLLGEFRRRSFGG